MVSAFTDVRPLSVLIVSPHPDILGGQTHFIETMKSYLKLCRVTSLYVGRVDPVSSGVTCWLSALVRLILVPIQAVWLVGRRSVDVVHLNPVMNTRSLIREGLILAALHVLKFRRTVIYFHGWQSGTVRCLAVHPVARRVFLALMRKAGRIMVLAPEFKTALADMGIDADRVTVTCTMFDGRELTIQKNVAQVPVALRRTVLFMARFHRLKGGAEMIDAFARLAADFPDLDLVMAGDGPEYAALVKKAADYGLASRILFTGYVRGQTKAEWLARCTIFALPTSYPEGMPVVLLEAMASGKVILTARAGGIEHIFSQPDNGVLLDRVTTDAVEDGLRYLLTHPDYCHMVGQHNAQTAWQQFEAQAVTAAMETIYREVAQLA